MEKAEPIKSISQINAIKNQLKWSNKIRDLLLFELWINSALRISDLLSIRVCHLFDSDLNIKSYFDIKESKTNKTHRVSITPKVKKTLEIYKKEYDNIVNDQNSFIFFHTKKSPIWSKSINRWMARILIQEWCKSVWLQGSYWWHTLRKTRWYQARMKWVSIELIQHNLNHSNIAVTKRYLWITDDELAKICNDMDL